MRKWIAFLCVNLILLSSCYAARIDGPYRGRVIDAFSEEPIEGVVVLGTWSREMVSPGGAVHSYYDAMETVTDKKGEFEIKGLGVLVMSNIIPMDVLIFKAGYEYVGGGWYPENSFYEKLTWDGERGIIPLKKLTMEERRKQRTPSRPSIPEEKMKLMTEEITKEDRTHFNRRRMPVGPQTPPAGVH